MVSHTTLFYSGRSPYGKYKIMDTTYDGRRARVLYGDGSSPQSGAAKDDNPDLLFDYNQRFLEMIMSRHPKRILVIGGGAFMLPIAAFHLFPDLHIDVVEIDALLVDLAHQYFELPDNPRLRVFVDDGAKFVARSRDTYDMIIIDAFSGYSIPHHLLEHDTIASYQKHLTHGGLVAVNFISEYKRNRSKLAHEIIASFDEVFSDITLYQADPNYAEGVEQNYILVAGHEVPHFEYLQTEEVEIFT